MSKETDIINEAFRSYNKRMREISERIKKATPGPWDARSTDGTTYGRRICRTDSSVKGYEVGIEKLIAIVVGDTGGPIDKSNPQDKWRGWYGHESINQEQKEADADFIAHAREDIEWLYTQLRAEEGNWPT